MKINLLTKSKVMILLALWLATMSPNANAQQYDYKYIGIYDQTNPALPYNDRSRQEQIPATSAWDCIALEEQTGIYYNHSNYCQSCDVAGNYSCCWREIAGSGQDKSVLVYTESVWGQRGASFHRSSQIYTGAEMGKYYMEIQGIAVMSGGLYESTYSTTTFDSIGVVWRHVDPTLRRMTAWPTGLTTYDNSRLQNWIDAPVTPKYKLLSNTNWSTAEVPGNSKTTVDCNTPTWISIPMNAPIVFNPDSNFELVLIKDSPQIISLWAYKDTNNIALAQTTCGNSAVATGNLVGFMGRINSSAWKPHLRLTYRYLSCEDVKVWANSEIYPDEVVIQPSDINFSFDMQYCPANADNHVYYAIVGPYPSTDTVYRTTQPMVVNQSVVATQGNLYTATLADFAGIPVAGQGANTTDNSVICSNLAPGEYKMVVSVTTQLEGFKPMVATSNIFIQPAQDITVRNLVEPQVMQEYPPTSNNVIGLMAEIANGGREPLSEFYVQALIYATHINPETGERERILPAIDTLPDNPDGAYHWTATQDNNGQALESGQYVSLYGLHFQPGFRISSLPVGVYDMEIKTWTTPEDWDLYHPNNTWPRAGQSHYIRVEQEFNVSLATEQSTPVANYRTKLGQTVYIETSIRNDGLLDLSDRSGYYLETSIYKYTNRAKGQKVWAPAAYVIRQGTAGQGYVTIRCIDDNTLAPIGWTVSDTGSFLVETNLLLRDAATGSFNTVAGQSSSRIFFVEPGLSGIKRIGGVGQDYSTIKAAVDALYEYGVSGDVRFELHNPTYNAERSWTTNNTEYPALDFRGKIPGVYQVVKAPDGTEAVKINTITFVPGGNLANQRASIQINLESKSGYGMRFGQADSSVAHPKALVNDVPIWEKSQWSQSDGYITWDGGPHKSIRISLRPPLGMDYAANDPIRTFRAPIYMSNARNITIKNCIIEENTLPPSGYFLLPGNAYTGSDLKWNLDYELAGSQTKTYSAGIVLRSTPPMQWSYNDNYFRFDTLPCSDITISGNEISEFSYGVASIGLNYLSGVDEYVINVVDTLRNMTLQDLASNPQKYFDCQRRVTLVNTPAENDTTQIDWYREQTSSILRGIRYYKGYTIRRANSGIVNSFVQVIDSGNGGIARVYNRNLLVENNIIHNVGRAGIFLGNDENSIIRGNTISGITGNVLDASGATPSTVDIAGILLGGNQRVHVTESTINDGFAVVGTEIYRNEISKLASSGSVYGINLEQVVATETVTSSGIQFPDRPERLKIYSNIIWDLQARTVNTNRVGLNLSLAKRVALAGQTLLAADTMYYSAANPNYFLDNILVANNTIVLGEDGFAESAGSYFGLRLQRLKNSRVINNAIELIDSTQFFTVDNTNNFAALIYYQGPTPSVLNNTIDYNAYGYKVRRGSEVDVYCHVPTNTDGGVVDVIHRGEYRTLVNWQNWIGTDLYSVPRNFAQDLQPTKEDYPRLRFSTGQVLSNSPLDKRGTYIAEAEVDIDGVSRILANQNLDIGAQYVNSTKFAYDVDLLNITSPATYKSFTGPFSDAEYFMINDEPIKVKAILRNNGSTMMQNKRITLRVYEEPEAVNNANTVIHDTSHLKTHYNVESALYNAQFEFTDIDIADAPVFWEGSQYVTLTAGQNTEVEFQLDKRFNSYYHLPRYNEPIQFAAMTPNVTPRYLFSLTADSTNDMDLTNNVFNKYARFYIKKSNRDILVSAVNTYHQLTATRLDEYGNPVLGEDGNPIIAPNTAIENLDWVAGKLNLDTLMQGLSRLKLQQVDNEAQSFDYDVFDRNNWDYRNVDYTLYKTLYIADELGQDESRFIRNHYDNSLRLSRQQWYAQNLVDFLESSSATWKKNLVVASENYISDIYKSLLQTDSQWVLNGRSQRDIFLYNDALRLAFLNNDQRIASLRDSLNKILVRDYFRANLVYDSLNDNGPYNWNNNVYPYEYLPVSPLYSKRQITEGELVREGWSFPPAEYRFTNKEGTIIGNSLNLGYIFAVRPTGWYWTTSKTVVDAPPYGTVFRPIDNLLGNLTIGALYDTVSANPDISSSNPNAGKAAALCVSTLNNNIVLLGFDWRHFPDVEMLLDNIMEYLAKNGSADDDNSLPISFYGFEANAISNRVDLQWHTSSGTVVSQFEVERTDVINGKIGEFQHIETIAAADNSRDNSYNSTDRNLAFGSKLAYRLKLLDASGNFTYTNIKYVDIEEAQFLVSDIAPNPVTSTSTFSVTCDTEQQLHIAVYDLSGKELLVLHSGTLAQGEHTFTIDSKHLPQSAYTLTVRGGQQTIMKQFSVTK